MFAGKLPKCASAAARIWIEFRQAVRLSPKSPGADGKGSGTDLVSLAQECHTLSEGALGSSWHSCRNISCARWNTDDAGGGDQVAAAGPGPGPSAPFLSATQSLPPCKLSGHSCLSCCLECLQQICAKKRGRKRKKGGKHSTELLLLLQLWGHRFVHLVRSLGADYLIPDITRPEPAPANGPGSASRWAHLLDVPQQHRCHRSRGHQKHLLSVAIFNWKRQRLPLLLLLSRADSGPETSMTTRANMCCLTGNTELRQESVILKSKSI